MSICSRSFFTQSRSVRAFCLIALASFCFLNSERYVINGLSAIANDDSSKAHAESIAVARANRAFVAPEMAKPSIDEKAFTFLDVGAKIPNYTAGRQWGTQGAPLAEMQNPLPAETSSTSLACSGNVSLPTVSEWKFLNPNLRSMQTLHKDFAHH